MVDRNLCFKRIIAFIIDAYISSIPANILSTLFKNHVTAIYGLFTVVLMILFFAMLICRDLIFGGRSIGKRLFGLTVIDNSTYRPAAPSKLVIRNLFFYICTIDGILLLFSGISTGERVTHTMVMSIKDTRISSFAKTPVAISSDEKSKTVKTVVCVVLVMAILFSALVLTIFALLEKVKDTEEYRIAYEYFTESDTFDALDVNEEAIKFTGYSKNTEISNGTKSVTLSITFFVRGDSYQIICHQDDSGWYVCQECTQLR